MLVNHVILLSRFLGNSEIKKIVVPAYFAIAQYQL